MKTIDQYFTVVARPTRNDSMKQKQRSNNASRWHPYLQHECDIGMRSGGSMHRPTSRARATEFLLRTLSSPHNPITHSDIPDRADRAISTATGHQVADQRVNRRLYIEDRERKLVNQREKAPDQKSEILSQTRIYIDGFLEHTTDIEIKRLITLAGGHVRQTGSGCTHIVTSRCLSASKMQTLLAGRSIKKVHLVKPEWVIDSVLTGKRQPEYRYSILQDVIRDVIYHTLK